jgi:hypothetical protein
MDLIAALVDVVAPVFAIIAIGFLWDRSGRSFEQKMVTDLVVLVGTPCLMFNSITGAVLPVEQMGWVALAALICPAVTALAAWSIIKGFHLKPKVYLPALTFPNVGNMGLPVCLFAFGQTGLAVAMVYFIVTNVLQFTFGPAIASGKADLWAAVRSPVVIASFVSLGVKFSGVIIPPWIGNGVTLVGGMVIPLMLLSLGVALSRFRVGRIFHTFVFASLRIVLGVVVGWTVAYSLGMPPAMTGAVVVQSSMPVAVFNFLYAEMYDNDPQEVAGMVLLSTILSVISLPILVSLLR